MISLQFLFGFFLSFWLFEIVLANTLNETNDFRCLAWRQQQAAVASGDAGWK